MKFTGITVPAEAAGKRVDLFLCTKYPRISRSEWQRRIEKGHVLVNKIVCRASRKLNAGDRISFDYEYPPEPDTAQEYKIVFEDDDLLVIDKPANLPVHPSGRYRNNTLHSFLTRDRGNQKIHFINRIDRETSGLVLLAKHSHAARILQEQMKSGNIDKEYLVVVIGNFPDYLDAVGFIGGAGSVVRKKRHFIIQNHPPGRGWQSCRTEFFLLKQEKGLSLLRARLYSGRLHQIRATLCSLGFPVAGDTLYGRDEKMYLKMIAGQMSEADWHYLGGHRSLLHSYRLAILHPHTAGHIILTAEIPPDFPLREENSEKLV